MVDLLFLFVILSFLTWKMGDSLIGGSSFQVASKSSKTNHQIKIERIDFSLPLFRLSPTEPNLFFAFHGYEKERWHPPLYDSFSYKLVIRFSYKYPNCAVEVTVAPLSQGAHLTTGSISDSLIWRLSPTLIKAHVCFFLNVPSPQVSTSFTEQHVRRAEGTTSRRSRAPGENA